jgi:hypothetical protein
MQYGPIFTLRKVNILTPPYRTVNNILTSAQDRLPFEDEPTAPEPTPSHGNIRGADYYATEEEK